MNPPAFYMDPYLEGPDWEDFHSGFIAEIAAALVPQVRPAFVVRKERRVYVAPLEHRETYVVIRSLASQEVVAVIEALSPGKKREGSEGRKQYLLKREEVLASDAHLVEIDLLRGGSRMPTASPLPPGDYFALVCRGRTYRAEVFAWTLRDLLPPIPVPLSGDTPDAVLELSDIFAEVYERSGYDYSLDRHRELQPPLSVADAAWLASHREPG